MDGGFVAYGEFVEPGCYGTVAFEPTLANLGALAVIVAIRTALSFALELEVSGRWPWHRTESVSTVGEP